MMDKFLKYRHQITAAFWGVILIIMLYLYEFKGIKISSVMFLTIAIMMFTSLKYAKVVKDYEEEQKLEEDENNIENDKID